MYKIIRTASRIVRYDNCFVFLSPHGSLRWGVNRSDEVRRLSSVYNIPIEVVYLDEVAELVGRVAPSRACIALLDVKYSMRDMDVVKFETFETVCEIFSNLLILEQVNA